MCCVINTLAINTYMGKGHLWLKKTGVYLLEHNFKGIKAENSIYKKHNFKGDKS